ncbi:MAG: N-acetyl-gamma-glutamyl-phosphate reductase [bacterium]|nr:N-acetyl-gamma-glutamyl-phosphate reductase [bacterium]MDT8366140.1 N-acetyl-gamma-glutamyl-phosphate reductase [bacterium]
MLNAGIVGVSGYTGMELVRILHGHPGVQLTYATSRSWAGQRIGNAIPHLAESLELVLSSFDAADAADKAEFFFVCLPHGESMETVGVLREAGLKVVDLSADFRFNDFSGYEKWYGTHTRIDLLAEAVYGMPELYREKIVGADLVANPGCYPTSVILGLAPLLAEGMVDPGTIVVDSKSGVSGAGRVPAPGLHFPETAGNFSAYNIAGHHRHIGEMEQELSSLAGVDVRITFSPHLLPVSRGILSTIYVKPSGNFDDGKLFSAFLEYYKEELFVRVNGPDVILPSLKDVRGTNLCWIGPRLDTRTGTVVIVSCIDNLVKGASGQAVQNMNLMMGFPETTGIRQTALHP